MALNLSFRKGEAKPKPAAKPAAMREPVRSANEANVADIDDPEQAVTAILNRIESVANELASEVEREFGERDSLLCQRLRDEHDDLRKVLNKVIEEQTRRYSLPGSSPEDNKGKRVNVAYVAQFLRTKRWPKGSGFEQEIYRNTRGLRVPGHEIEGAEYQDMQAEPDSSAGYFIPGEQSTEYIDKLRATPVVAALGATIIETSNAGIPFSIPRVTTDTTAKWGGETIEIPTSDMGTGRLEMRPKSLRAASIVTNLALEHSAVPLDTLLRMNHEEQLALGLDLGALNGDGGNQPRGVIQTPGVNSVTFGSSVKFGWSKGQEMLHKLREDNAFRGRLGWAMNPTALYHAQIAGNEGDPTAAGAIELGRRMLTEAPITNLLGYPFQTSTQMPATGNGAVIFGAWQDLIMLIFKGVTVDVTSDGKDLMLDDETLVRTLMRADIGIRHKESFCIAASYNA